MIATGCVFPEKVSSYVWAFVIDLNDGFIFVDDVAFVPQPWGDVAELFANVLTGKHYLGRFNDMDCILYVIDRREDPDLLNRTVACNLRALFDVLDADIWFAAGYAWQIFEWDQNFKYCGRCGVGTSIVKGERARRCDDCGLVSYPRISPSMIVLVQKDDEILLAKNAQFRGPFYSLLAGFLEPGETLYECVAREVHEEVGLKVKNIRFFESQYWPMSANLMLGCIADYDSGEIQIDQIELEDAAWFKADALPIIPNKSTIARVMIDHFIQLQTSQ